MLSIQLSTTLLLALTATTHAAPTARRILPSRSHITPPPTSQLLTARSDPPTTPSLLADLLSTLGAPPDQCLDEYSTFVTEFVSCVKDHKASGADTWECVCDTKDEADAAKACLEENDPRQANGANDTPLDVMTYKWSELLVGECKATVAGNEVVSSAAAETATATANPSAASDAVFSDPTSTSSPVSDSPTVTAAVNFAADANITTVVKGKTCTRKASAASTTATAAQADLNLTAASNSSTTDTASSATMTGSDAPLFTQSNSTSSSTTATKTESPAATTSAVPNGSTRQSVARGFMAVMGVAVGVVVLL